MNLVIKWSCAASLSLLLVGSGLQAAEWQASGVVSGELRLFPSDPAFADQSKAHASFSVSVEPEFEAAWDNNVITVVPFARVDSLDDRRTHFDLREANWLYEGDRWDVVVGLDRIFWGVTESRHLVDIINQFDGVEDIDSEDKLGQPMVNVNFDRDWGAVSLFVLPGFRERTFPDSNARLRGPLFVDDDQASYDSASRTKHVDLAVRWLQTFGPWDIALSHFHGTSREPRFLVGVRGGQFVLTPHYDQIDQTGLELQYTGDATLWKLEAITRSGHGDRFVAAVGGLEHTLFGVFGSRADLGLLAEYQYDGRSKFDAPGTPSDDDFFAGMRLALNDEQDTSVLFGATVDRRHQTTGIFLEAERRVGQDWKVELEGRLFINVDDADIVAGIRDDDFFTLRLNRYF